MVETACPHCHRPYIDRDSPSQPRQEQRGSRPGFVDSEYFDLLARSTPGSAESSRPSSPIKRVLEPPSVQDGTPSKFAARVESLDGSPTRRYARHGLSADAFTAGYYKHFFREKRELGRGGKGVVLLVEHYLEGILLGEFACKRVPVGDDHEWLKKVLVEVKLLQSLQHENLVRYQHVWLEEVQITTFGPIVPCAFILQQYCNSGDLHKYLTERTQQPKSTLQELKAKYRRRSKGESEAEKPSNGYLPFDEIFSFFKDITSGLSYLHAHGYIHRDLKPSNCLLHQDGARLKVLVSDFGEVQTSTMERTSTGATGTISYCAPEVLRRNPKTGALGDFTFKSDIFSLGMIVYFMCFACLPYSNADINEENEDLDQLRSEITAWPGLIDERRPRDDLPEQLYRNLRRLLSLDPAERPSTDEILQGIRGNEGFVDPGVVAPEPPPSSREVPNHSRIISVGSPSPSPMKRRTSSAERPLGRSMLRDYSPHDSSPSSRQHKSSMIIRQKSSPSPPSLSPRPLPSPLAAIMPPPLDPPTATDRLATALRDPQAIKGLRVSLFLFRVLSVVTPCTPYAANPYLLSLLLGLAAFDAVSHPEVSFTLTLNVVHCFLLGTAWWWGSLCQA